MVGVDSEIASSVLRLWIAAGSAAVLVAICAVAFNGLRTNAARAGVVGLGALVGVAMIWALLGNPIAQDHAADRRALELRAHELTARTLAPGSALACLDAVAGDNVDAACEKALFASAANVAAASSYAAARLELLADMTAYVKHGGRDIDGALLPLRHSLETDAFGFVAHALAVRDGCTGQNCKALDVLHDASRVRANLSGQTLDRYLDRYLTAWAQPDSPAPVADAAPQSQPTYQPGAPGPRKMVNIDFPTAASIPPVSIMNPEPGTKPAPASAAAAANPNPQAPAASTASAPPAKKSRKQAASPPPQAPAPAVSPPPAAVVEQPDPVWTPAPPAQAVATTPAPAANFISGGTAPQ